MILLKLVTLFKAPFIQREKRQREKDRLRGRKRERPQAEWNFNEFSHGRRKNDCESWQRRTRFQLRWFLLCHQIFYFLFHNGRCSKKGNRKWEREMSGVSFSSRCVTLLPHVAFLTLLKSETKMFKLHRSGLFSNHYLIYTIVQKSENILCSPTLYLFDQN